MKLENITSPRAGELFGPDTIAVLPLGTVEVHGKHLPLNTDMLAPEYVVREIDTRMSNLIVLPSWHYGNCDSQTDFPGTITLGGDLLYRVLMRIFDSLYAQGIRRFAVVNGHGPNSASVEKAAATLHVRGAQLAVMNWWRYVWDINSEWTGGHGGGQETSAILALAPELVDQTAFEPSKAEGISVDMPANGWDNVLYKGVNIPVPRTDIHVTDNGWLGNDPLEEATAQKGKDMLEAAVSWGIDFLTAFRKLPVL